MATTKAKQYRTKEGTLRELIPVSIRFHLDPEQVTNLWLRAHIGEMKLHPDSGEVSYFPFPYRADEVMDAVRAGLHMRGAEDADLSPDDDFPRQCRAAIAHKVRELEAKIRRLLKFKVSP